INSLAQTVLKMTIPGVPDIYQGQELWDFSLVDPDNRRPVDFDLRAAELERLRGASPTRLLEEWRDGRIKLLITHQLLTLRKTYPDLFQSGTYLPLKAEGEFARSCIAFQRQEKERSIVVIVPRLSSQVATPPLGDAWKDTCISNNHGFQSATELFTGLQLPAADHLFLRDALRELPVAVYVSNG
ncbi:MAG: malto-oligosyltrehalose synthase, partial [Verrucomicrobiota bacterium]